MPRTRTVLVRNLEGIPVMLSIFCNKSRHGLKYTVYGAAKRFPEDVSCVCSDGYDGCKCNWSDCFTVPGGYNQGLLVTMKSAAAHCNKVERCKKCQDLMYDDAEFGGECGSCIMQKHVATSAPRIASGAECPVCLENIFRDEATVLPCTHMLHVHCARRISQCPYCRSPFNTDTVLDHLPPKLSAC